LREDTVQPGQDTQGAVTAEAAPDGHYVLRVFNPLPKARDGVVEAVVAFPAAAAFPATRAEPFGYETLNNFRLADDARNEISYSLRSVRRNVARRFHLQDVRRYDEYTVVFRAELTPCGWTTFRLAPSERPVRHFGTLFTGRQTAENGLVRLEVLDDGTFTLTDLRSGRRYPGQNRYRIDREIGDGWNHVAPAGTATGIGGSCATVRVTHDGPARAEMEIVRRFELPRELVYAANISERFDGIRESAESATLVLRTRVALDAGSPSVRVVTEIDNTVRDYRLRLSMPTGIPGDFFVNQAGTFLVRRPGCEHGDLSQDYIETEKIDRNFSGIVGKRDGRGGLAFLSRSGLHEAGGLEGAEGELVITLLRAFRRTVHTNGEEDGQLQRTLRYEYRLRCIAPDEGYDTLVDDWLSLRAPTPHYLVRAEPGREAAPDGFVTLEGGLSFACLKPADDGAAGCAVLRVVNLAAGERTGRARFARPFRRAVFCRLDETETAPAAEGGDTLELKAGSGKMVTIKVWFPEVLYA